MKTACITGASSGIGKEFAKLLSKSGYQLILIARNTEVLQELSDSLQTKCEIISCDLSIEEECRKLADRLKKYNISIMINNAGFGDLGTFEESDLNKQLDMIKVNISALHILTHELLPGMISRDHGYILNVASSAGLMYGGPYMATYYATKAYVTSLTSGIYHELKERKSNVHISMLCPGPVDTNFNKVANVAFSLRGISASYCAAYALKQMSRGKLTIIPTFTMKAAIVVSRLSPRKMVLAIAAGQQKKKVYK